MSPARILEAVPNFSEGRDVAVVEAIVAAMRAAGAAVLDWSADPDHNRSVVTLAGPPETVEDATIAGARVAVDRIDLNRHAGVHPRVGALDVLPFVPLAGLTPADARALAQRAGRRLAREVGLPVYFYSDASEPPGRPLSVLRKGGFERLRTGWPADRPPDVLPDGWAHPGAHPTAGVTCVGARPVLLAWNIFVAELDEESASGIASAVREANGGFPGVRALAFHLPESGRLQISMNLEDPDRTPPMDVFLRIESLVLDNGGRIEETEIIGMIPDQLVLGAAADRLRMRPHGPERLLSRGILGVLTGKGPASREA